MKSFLIGTFTDSPRFRYAITLLALEPRWQVWVREEIQAVLRSVKASEEPDYEKIFPQLKRCLAVMFETLRFYSPVVNLPRQVLTTPQHLTVASKSHLLPANTFVCLNFQALHTNPAFWGPDSLTWRPDRWLPDTPPHVLGSFSAWSSGPRVCPGKKFAQVEFVAVLSKLLRSYKVNVVSLDGETEQERRERASAVLEDSGISVTLKMKHPEKISLRWEEVA